MATMSWEQRLQQFVEAKGSSSSAGAAGGAGPSGAVSAASEADVEQMTVQCIADWHTPTAAAAAASTYQHIPRFYRKCPDENDAVRMRVREEARARHVQRLSKEMLTNSDLDVVWALLQRQYSSQENEEKMINFDDFVRVGQEAGEKFSSYFTSPMVYAKLYQQDPRGRLPISRLYAYIMRKVWLQQTRIGLSLYDSHGTGVLLEVDFENYILELIPTLPQLNGLEDSFYSFFVCSAVRKFFFFLDPLRTGKVKVQDIMSCKFLDELLQLRDDKLTADQQRCNWFSAPHALRVYGQYLALDLDHNGMLSKQELMGYGTGTLSPVFVDRVFDECLTYEGEMDYKGYLDFVLAMENRKEPQALHFFVRLLDVQNLGYIDMFSVYYFFKDIQRMLEAHGQPMVQFEDVKDEIFDMVKPVDSLKITLEDLLRCGQGDTVISLLIDLKGFWLYENREQLAADPSQLDAEDEDDDEVDDMELASSVPSGGHVGNQGDGAGGHVGNHGDGGGDSQDVLPVEREFREMSVEDLE
ncbi:serine/threonine-protein phosphatase 2A regulatory subunit B'' subunit gamma-like isoform X1 [Sycon ciliatum]|uniref:serine/threonine-protein phosphatase 2A regulatory subunit B'' subunit gamma-like isoform X1 n=2 Tax=Sycon ciliatum TaxID=27933 RepID=UPI0031F7192B